jgi:hypothetical protein
VSLKYFTFFRFLSSSCFADYENNLILDHRLDPSLLELWVKSMPDAKCTHDMNLCPSKNIVQILKKTHN